MHRFVAAIIRVVSYRYGIPFIISAALAVFGRAGWRQPTSIWSFALIPLIATLFALLWGGQFRIVYVAIAVVPSYLFVLQWYLQMRSWIPNLSIKPFAEFFLYFVASPILIVWLISTLLDRRQRHA
jgi:hypothetical protein